MSTLSMLSTVLLTLLSYIVYNLLRQIYLRGDPRRPPVVFHLLPVVGSTIEYGIDPYAFFSRCRAEYGDCFTFILLGRRTTVFLGARGNQFILNGSSKELNAEDVYRPLTAPIFGRGVVYDCPNARLMDQKRILIKGFSGPALRAYVSQFEKEVEQFIETSHVFEEETGICDISAVMAEITLYTAAGSLQGREIREKMDSEVALLYRHLDDGFISINNIRRDHAQKKMADLYMDVIRHRRATMTDANILPTDDMISILMKSSYRDSSPIPDLEIANLMIALLMGGQHNTSATSTWIILHLAHRPHLIEELYQEQLRVLGSPLPPLTHSNIQELKLNSWIIKETLRLHSPIHSVMRKVTQPMSIPDTPWVVPPGHTLLAAPSFLSQVEEFWPDAKVWDPYRWENPNKASAASSQQMQQTDDPGEVREKGKSAPLHSDTIDFGYGPVSLKAANSPYLPFGAGRHRCVGEEYAYLQLGTIIATLVRLLQWEQVDPTAKVPKTDYSSMFSRPMHPATIKWRRRR